ncbi:unnamed protein product [Dimorphilus gyrociliatus]|uniref:Uncharacterized protein n=1 Tax=Dimorphilus gyrociliatus TaxID=2664684 RepID=A0A7I8VN83_9ANNE|nr:unnamed protein product [Dimorphilus gyrociliatus]
MSSNKAEKSAEKLNENCDCDVSSKCIHFNNISKCELETYLATLEPSDRRNYAIKHNIPLNPFFDQKVEWSPSTFTNVKHMELFNDSLPSPNVSLMEDDHHSIIHQHSIASCEHREILADKAEMSKTFFENYTGPPSPGGISVDIVESDEEVEDEKEKKGVDCSTQTEWCIDPDWKHIGRVPFLRLLPTTEDDLCDASHIVYLPLYKRAHWRPMLATEALPKAYFTDGRGTLMCDNYRKLIEGDEGPSGMTPNEYRLVRRVYATEESPHITPKFPAGKYIESPCGLNKFSPKLSPITPQTRSSHRSASSAFRLNISPILANSPDLYGTKRAYRIRQNSGTTAPFTGQLSFCLDDDEDEDEDEMSEKDIPFEQKEKEKPAINSTLQSENTLGESTTDQGYMTMSNRASEMDVSDAVIVSTPTKNGFLRNFFETASESKAN